MTTSFYIALRFLSHRKRAFLLSSCGVVFGVSIFICTQAQTQGFAQNFINSTLGSNGALVVRESFEARGAGLFVAQKTSAANKNTAQRRYSEGISNAREIMRVSRQFSNVAACSPVLRGTLSARSGFENANVDLYGIDPLLHTQTTDLKSQIVAGSFDDFRDNVTSAIVGSRLAEVLNVTAGDSLQLLSTSGEFWRFTVAAIARSGVGVIDGNRVYCHVAIAQKVLRKPFAASMILYKLRDPQRAPELAKEFERLFQHESLSWQDREAANLQLFLTLRMSVAITVSLIILLAGFGIFNVLTMTVLSKVREIAILRSMGYRRGDVSAIFLWQGAMIALVGSVIGCALGAIFTWLIAQVPIRVRGILYANHFLVAWDWHHYFWATLLAAIAVSIASYVPARRAALLPPVVTLRGASL